MAPIAKTAEQIVAEMLSKATRNERGCLISHLRPNAKGYVPVQVGGRSGMKWRGHRLVFFVKKGYVDPDLMVLHSCDTRNCIEIEHLFEGTAKDNTQDMLEKGRAKNGGKTKVTSAVFEQMKLHRARGLTNVTIGHILGLSHETVRAYLNGTFSFPTGDEDSVCV